MEVSEIVTEVEVNDKNESKAKTKATVTMDVTMDSKSNFDVNDGDKNETDDHDHVHVVSENGTSADDVIDGEGDDDNNDENKGGDDDDDGKQDNDDDDCDREQDIGSKNKDDNEKEDIINGKDAKQAIDDDDDEKNSHSNSESDTNEKSQEIDMGMESQQEQQSDDDSSSDEDDKSDNDDNPQEDDKSNNHNNNDKKEQETKKIIPTDEYGRELSAYEIMRLERIQRNKAYLAQLGLEEEKSQAKIAHEKEMQRKRSHKKKETNMSNSNSTLMVERRQSRARKSKTKEVDYTYSDNLLNLFKMQKKDKLKKKESDSNNNNDSNSNNTSEGNGDNQNQSEGQGDNNDNEQTTNTNEKKSPKKKSKRKDEMLPRFVYLEFEHIKKTKNKAVATSKRLIKLAELECRIAKRNVEIHQNKERRRMDKEKRRLALQNKKMLLPVIQELDSRRAEIQKARKEFDAWQHKSSSSALQKKVNREAALTDAKIGFPLAIQRNERLLDLMLHERLIPHNNKDGENSGESNSKKNKGKSNKRKRKNENENQAENKDTNASASTSTITSTNKSATTCKSTNNSKSVESPSKYKSKKKDKDKNQKKKKKNSTTPTDDSVETTSKKIHIAKSRNVGGPVTESLSSSVQRKWLERDVPVPADISTHFAPQVGDVVLYYPCGHHEFLQEQPDIRCRKNRLALRKPLWERAKEERELMEESTKKDIEQLSKKAKLLLNTKPWWTPEWIQSVDSKAGSYPIICRVEKVIAEFPFDSESMKEIRRFKYQSSRKSDIGNDVEPQEKTKRRLVDRKKPSLGLCVTLRPLSTISPPRHSKKRGVFFVGSKLSIPPVFSVLTFPCNKAPFLVPFYLAYRLSLSVSNGDSIKLLDGDCAQQYGTVCSQSKDEKDDNNSALDLFLKIVNKDAAADLSTVSKLDDFISACYEADSNINDTILPEANLRAATAVALYQCHKRKIPSMKIHRPGNDDENENNGEVANNLNDQIPTQGGGDIANLVNWLLTTLPRWKGTKIMLNDEDKTECFKSVWDFITPPEDNDNSQEGILAVALAPSILITAPCTYNGGFIYTLDQNLRSDIEQVINEFILKSDDAASFVANITDRSAPEYSRFVPVTMSFRRILRRLKIHEMKYSKLNHYPEDPMENYLEDGNGSYYRSVGALLTDITDIYQNCLLYNDPDSDIVQTAFEITKQLKTAIGNIELQWLSTKKEERQQARHAALVASGEEKRSVSSKPNSKHKFITESFDESYNGVLSREWIMNSALLVGKDISLWIPQCGDKILYNRQLHGKFVNGHFSSLSKEQRILPSILPRRKKVKQSDKAAVKSAKLKDFDVTEKYQYWLGTVAWVRTCFPHTAAPTGLKSFDTSAPILAIGIKFHYNWLSKDIHIVHWRPCRVQEPSLEAEIIGDSCKSCGLAISSSFLTPAWTGPIDKLLPPYPISLATDIRVPSGIQTDRKNRIDICLDLLRRRILTGDAMDSYTPNKKYLKSTNLQNIPSKFHYIFEDESDVGDEPSNSSEGSSFVGNQAFSEDTTTKLLREHAFVPPWTLSDKEQNTVATRAKSTPLTGSDVEKRQLHETLVPDPYLCLQMIQTRIKNGHYRDLIAVAHDIREAFLSLVFFIIKEKIVTKQISQDSRKQILQSITHASVKLEQVSASKISKQGSQEIPTAQEENGAQNVSYPNLHRKEILLIKRIESIRKLYATSLTCLFETNTAEIALGVDIWQETKAEGQDTNAMEGPSADQLKFKKTLNKIMASLSLERHNTRKPLPKTSPLPTVQIKIKPPTKRITHAAMCVHSNDMSHTNDASEFLDEPIVITPNEYEKYPTLKRALFCPFDKTIQVKIKVEGTSPKDTKKSSILFHQNDYINNLPLIAALFCPHERRNINVKVNLLSTKVFSKVTLDDEDTDMNKLDTPETFSDSQIYIPSNSSESIAPLKASDDIEVDFSKHIRMEPVDYTNNENLIRALFGQPKRKDSCARCKLGRNNFLTCRIRKAHTNVDFIWNDFIKNIGGVDGILQKLKPHSHSLQTLSISTPKKDQSNNVITSTSSNTQKADNNVIGHLSQSNETLIDESSLEKNETIEKTDNLKDEEHLAAPNNISPLDILSNAEELLRLAEKSLQFAIDDLKMKPRLSEEFLNRSNFLDPDDGHYEICNLCGMGGDVLCCESCAIVSHSKCVGLDTVPDGDWYCENCIEKSNFQHQDDSQEGVLVVEVQRPDTLRLETLLNEMRLTRQKDKETKEADEDEKDPELHEEKDKGQDTIEDEDTTEEVDESEKDAFTVGMKIAKCSLFQHIGEIISLPTKNGSFYEVRYDDGEMEKLEFDQVQEGISLYKKIEDSDVFENPNDLRSRRRRSPLQRYGSETPKSDILSLGKRKRGRPTTSDSNGHNRTTKGSSNKVRKKVKVSKIASNNTPQSERKRGRPRKTELLDSGNKVKVKRKVVRSKKMKKENTITVEDLEWSPRAGFADPSMTYYCTIENDTPTTIARKVGVEWLDVANEAENSVRFPSLQNKRTRFRKGTLVRIPIGYKRANVNRLTE